MTFVHWGPLLEGMLEAVWVVDSHNLRIVAVNTPAGRLLGMPTSDLLGQPVIELTASPEDACFWEDVAAGLVDSIHSETLLRRADGHTVLVDRRVSQVAMDGGERVYLVGLQDLSEQRHNQNRLEHLVAELRATLESTADGILVCDLDGGIRAYNRHFAHLWALPEELLTHRDDQAVHTHLANQVLDTTQYQQRLGHIGRSPLLEATDVLVLRSGHVLERSTLPQLTRGRPTGRVYAFRDISDRLAAETQMQLGAKVFENSLDAIFITDANHRIVLCNPMAGRLTQKPPAELEQASTWDLFFSRQEADLSGHIQDRMERAGYWEGEAWHRRPDGSAVALQVSWVQLKNPAGVVLHTVVFAKDLTEKLAAQQRIEQLAYTDPLTGLPNRLMLTERVGYALQLAQRNQVGFAVLFLDLDRFKHINDSLGHLQGDRVLLEVANRLKGCLRQTDTLCRLGGDEFVIHLHEADAQAAELTARRIQKALDTPVQLESMNFSLSCSMGIALYPTDGQTLDELIQHADTAMYRVKERSKGSFRFYQPQMNIDVLSRVKMDHAMREGLDNREFQLHYQPRIGLANGGLQGGEALLRWHNPTLGTVPPGTFIGVAEETGFIVQLGQWVLDQAVAQAAVWARLGTPCVVSVNVSPLQFQQSHFVEQVAQVLQTHGLDPALLELELTESILIHDAEENLDRLQALTALGVALSLDDFGTGYSSLSYLKRFPLHTLKIDRSFIQSMHTQDSDAAIVAAIVQMGHALGLSVVAEGVEHAAQRDMLARLGCDQYQGFLSAPGLPATAFTQDWLQPGAQRP
jgi:diguanylate cyclase (GGDEF)-like protein/PAS domain S-box-containing protein